MTSSISNILSRWPTDRLLLWLLRVAAIVAGAIVVLIVGFLVVEALPVLRHAGVARFLTDSSWHPTEGLYNLTPMLWGTLFAMVGAVLIATPLGILSALFCQFYAPLAVARPYRKLIELLAGIPSVVYGFWGLVVLVPLIGSIHPPGPSLLAGIVVLAIMILPTIALMADAGLANVPQQYVPGAAALGLSRWATIQGVVLPAAKSGLFTGVILETGRAIGETMAILMVCGNVVQTPHSLFDPMRTLTANIALEMAYALGDHRAALFVSGLVLMGMIMALVAAETGSATEESMDKTLERHRDEREWLAATLVWSAAALVTATFCWLLGDILWHGLSHLSWEFLTTPPRNAGREGGIAPILISTALILGVCLGVSLPIGVGTAVLLTEFTTAGSLFGRLTRRSLDVLAGVPSIIFGLFGNALFCQTLGLGFSILSGGLTLACMVLPILIRSTEEGFRAVPTEYRLSAAALGLSRATTLFHLLLPAAVPGLLVGLVLGVGRALAETAALIFTSGYVDRMPESLLDSGRALSLHIFDLSMNVSGGDATAYASALVLVVSLLAINGTASWLAEHWLHRRIVTI